MTSELVLIALIDCYRWSRHSRGGRVSIPHTQFAIDCHRGCLRLRARAHFQCCFPSTPTSSRGGYATTSPSRIQLPSSGALPCPSQSAHPSRRHYRTQIPAIRRIFTQTPARKLDGLRSTQYRTDMQNEPTPFSTLIDDLHVRFLTQKPQGIRVSSTFDDPLTPNRDPLTSARHGIFQ